MSCFLIALCSNLSVMIIVDSVCWETCSFDGPSVPFKTRLRWSLNNEMFISNCSQLVGCAWRFSLTTLRVTSPGETAVERKYHLSEGLPSKSLRDSSSLSFLLARRIQSLPRRNTNATAVQRMRTPKYFHQPSMLH